MKAEARLGGAPTPCDERDAIHIAIVPVFAAERLFPGQDVGLIRAGWIGKSSTPIGIVDPFLKACVGHGDRCWLLLYPGTITSLRHDWTHPAFPEKT